jgi:hypothetical protein
MKLDLPSRIVKNNSLIKSKLLLSLIVVSMISVFFFAPKALTVTAQDEKKIITFARTINPQLKITEIKVGNKTRTFNEGFDAESEWVKNLIFKLENISSKPIVYLKVNVNFPETRANGNLMSYGVTFGQRPGSKLKQINLPLLLKPGETFEVFLEKEKEGIYKFINERQPVELIKKIELEISFIIFDDKTAWSAGSFMRQDPENPDKYNPEPQR